MSLLDVLSDTIRGRTSPDRTPAVLCGDRLSNAAAVAAHASGRSFQPYAIAVDDNAAGEVQWIADQLGWRLKLILLSTERLAADFLHLAVQQRCFTRDEMEFGYLAMHFCEAVEEPDVWLSLHRWHRKQGAWQAATRIAACYGKSLFNPYMTATQINIDDALLRLMVHEAKAKSARREDVPVAIDARSRSLSPPAQGPLSQQVLPSIQNSE